MINSLRDFRHRLRRWYRANRRDLPWRVPPTAGASEKPDPYRVLVSEAMLQQTQVATVVPYFGRFLAQFPSLAALAAADEQAVLRAWQGLGYYARARNLQAAARRIVAEFGGVVPSDPAVLLTIPGVGRYTAGAVASLAYDRRAPILDGNVARVLCRIDKVESDPRDKPTTALLWARAEAVLPRTGAGEFNSALMELGATVCTPRNPQCLACPVRAHCEAATAGLQDRIPPPRKAKPTPLERRWTIAVRDGQCRYLIEQRPPRGRWAGMWQFLTLPADDAAAAPELGAVKAATGLAVGPLARVGLVAHALTHRRYEFDVFTASLRDNGVADVAPRRWATLGDLGQYPLPRPHLKIVELLVRDRSIGSSGH